MWSFYFSKTHFWVAENGREAKRANDFFLKITSPCEHQDMPEVSTQCCPVSSIHACETNNMWNAEHAAKVFEQNSSSKPLVVEELRKPSAQWAKPLAGQRAVFLSYFFENFKISIIFKKWNLANLFRETHTPFRTLGNTEAVRRVSLRALQVLKQTQHLGFHSSVRHKTFYEVTTCTKIDHYRYAGARPRPFGRDLISMRSSSVLGDLRWYFHGARGWYAADFLIWFRAMWTADWTIMDSNHRSIK